MDLQNTPTVKMGIAAASRDCFPIALAKKRLANLVAACGKINLDVIPAETVIETDVDAMKASAEMRDKGANAVAIYLGNFGPEGPETIFAKEFNAPFMLCGAAEESEANLVDGRGDAFCGMLNASYNAGLRGLRPYIPPMPIGSADDVARMIAHFTNVARVLIGLKRLRIFAFGPRPQDFYACNAPIKPLYDLGVEVMENSELDLFQFYKGAADNKDTIDAVKKDMAAELGAGNTYPAKLSQLAQFEVALTTFMERNLGSREFGIFANKCWPSFEPAFGFVPCYVNSRLAGRGIPVACEVDIYGALSEYMAQLASGTPATLLDVNNTVPPDLEIADLKGAAREDLFMGFHCGNTPKSMLCSGCSIKYQLIMRRLMEPDVEPDITCGTLEGTLKPGPATVFRLQSSAACELKSYLAEGHVLDADPHSFGAIGIIGIPNFARFYRYVLVGKQFPHHTALCDAHAGRVLFDAVRMLGVTDLNTPLPAGRLYDGENPF